MAGLNQSDRAVVFGHSANSGRIIGKVGERAAHLAQGHGGATIARRGPGGLAVPVRRSILARLMKRPDVESGFILR